MCGSEFAGWYFVEADEVELSDVDHDGDLDVVWTGTCVRPDGDRWAFGIDYTDPGGTQHSTELTVFSSPARVVGGAVADIDEDGAVDHVVGHPDDPVAQLVLDRGQSGSESVTIPVPSPVADVAVADIDADGHVDLIATASDAGRATVLYGDGTGSFGDAHTLVTGGSSAGEIAVADLDGDGRDDLVIGRDGDDPAESAIVVMRNTLDGRGH